MLTQAGVPCGRFHAYDEMCLHPQVRINSLMAEVPTPHWGTVRVAGLPWSFSLTPGVLRSGPLWGSDTADVLDQTGLFCVNGPQSCSPYNFVRTALTIQFVDTATSHVCPVLCR